MLPVRATFSVCKNNIFIDLNALKIRLLEESRRAEKKKVFFEN